MEKLRSILVIIGGIILLLGGFFHSAFWNLFDWNDELSKLNQINSNIMQMLNLWTAASMFLFGFILIFLRKDILNSLLGKAILVAVSILFLVRLVSELALPQGSIVFAIILCAIAFLYLIPIFLKQTIEKPKQ